jgi:hypothetical protein
MCRKAATATDARLCDGLRIAERVFSTAEGVLMSNDFEFRIACGDCGTRGIEIETSPEAVLTCSNCGGSLETVGALRALATRMQELSQSTKLRSTELVSLRDELKNLRRKVQTANRSGG